MPYDNLTEEEKRLFERKLTQQDLTERVTTIRIPPQKRQWSGEVKLEPAVLSLKHQVLSVSQNGQVLYSIPLSDIKRAKTQLGETYLITKQGTKVIIFDDETKDDQELGVEILMWEAIFKHAGVKNSGIGKPVLLAILFLVAFLGWLFTPLASIIAIVVFVVVLIKM